MSNDEKIELVHNKVSYFLSIYSNEYENKLQYLFQELALLNERDLDYDVAKRIFYITLNIMVKTNRFYPSYALLWEINIILRSMI